METCKACKRPMPSCPNCHRPYPAADPAIDHRYDQAVARIMPLVCHYFQVEPDHVLNGDRHGRLVYARHIIWWLLRRVTRDMPFERIGQIFNNRDHSTVIYGVDKIDRMLPRNKNLQTDIGVLADYLLGDTINLEPNGERDLLRKDHAAA